MQETSCPDLRQLADYLERKLPAAEDVAIAEHLEVCLGCRSRVSSLRQQQGDVSSSNTPSGSGEVSAVEAPKDASPAAEPSAISGQLGEYRLLEKLGEGGMGAVYKALHTRLDKIVALKMLQRAGANDEWIITRFEREMKAVGRLNHPNIIQAYDAREIGGTRFLVTEFVDGMDLSDLVGRYGPLPVADACELTRQAALGLQAAHEIGLVHRDVKPSNLMLTRHGQVKLLDLGLARLQSTALPTGESLTSAGQIMGTADYMAPEQVSDCHNVDIRADIYSLGCTLYKLLTGEVLFGGALYKSHFDKMAAHVLKAPAPIRQLRPEVPEALVLLVDRMLAKKPEERQATPAEVSEALTPFSAGSNLLRLFRQCESRPKLSTRGKGLGPADALQLSTQNHHDRTLGAEAAGQDSRQVAAEPVVIGSRWAARRARPLAAAIGVLLLAIAGLATWQAMHDRSRSRDAPSGQSGEAVVMGTKDNLPELAPVPPAIALDAQRARAQQEEFAKQVGVAVEQTNSIGMKLVLIPPGEFRMGSADTVLGKLRGRPEHPSETPAHTVVIPRPFLLGAYEVTQAEYQKVMGVNPSLFRPAADSKDAAQAAEAGRRPVERVSWSDAVEFCRRLSTIQAERSAQRAYRLPTEAEWEYACRAGTTTRWLCGDNEAALGHYAWFTPLAGDTTHPVGQKKANAWGLYDVAGNVSEWCSDWYSPDYYQQSPKEDPVGPPTGLDHVARGGSWWNVAPLCRSAARHDVLSSGSENIGFRVACEVPARLETARPKTELPTTPKATPAEKP